MAAHDRACVSAQHGRFFFARLASHGESHGLFRTRKVVAGPVSRFLTTISSIQRATTLDILAGMDEATKTRIERERAAVLWSR